MFSIKSLFEKKETGYRRKLIFELVEDLMSISKISNDLSDVELVELMDNLRFEFEENYNKEQ
jgi:hypothetical protein